VGVSNATVSLALSGNPRISESTRRRVQAEAALLGYQPAPELRALTSRRWANRKAEKPFAVAMLTEPGHAVSEEFLAGVESTCRELGYLLQRYRSSDFNSPDQASRLLHQRGVAGVLVHAFFRDPAFLEGFDASRFAVVQCHHMPIPMAYSHVRHDQAESIRMGSAAASAQGCRKLGIAILADALEHVREAAAEAAFLRLHPPRGLRSVRSFIAGFDDRERFLAWFEKEQPDLLLGHPQTMAWLEATGSPCRFIGIGALWDRAWPSLRIDYRTIGEEAIRLLDQKVMTGQRGPTPYPRRILIPPQWLVPPEPNEGTLRVASA